MRNLRLCVTPKQFHKLEHAINAVGEFHTLFASSRYDLYCRRYPFVAKYEDGKTETIQNAMEYGSWISQYGLPDQKKEYQEWIDNRSKLVREIDYLLYVNLDAMDKGVDAIEAHSIPTELERSTDFSVLFPIACKWFFNEIGRGVRRWCCGPECADHCESCAPKKETEK